jgi:hypothetical protein
MRQILFYAAQRPVLARELRYFADAEFRGCLRSSVTVVLRQRAVSAITVESMLSGKGFLSPIPQQIGLYLPPASHQRFLRCPLCGTRAFENID